MQMWKKTFCYIELNVASIKCLRKSSSSLDPIEHTRIHSYLITDLFCPHVYCQFVPVRYFPEHLFLYDDCMVNSLSIPSDEI